LCWEARRARRARGSLRRSGSGACSWASNPTRGPGWELAAAAGAPEGPAEQEERRAEREGAALALRGYKPAAAADRHGAAPTGAAVHARPAVRARDPAVRGRRV